MDAVAITVGSSWTLTGFIIIVLATPLVRGLVGRNRFYGVGYPQSFQSDDAWYAINRYGGRRLIVWAFPLILVGIGCFFLPLQAHPNLALAVYFAPLLFILMPIVEAWHFAWHFRSGV